MNQKLTHKTRPQLLKKTIKALILTLALPALAMAQTATTAPLTLRELLDSASQFYPTLRAARFEAQATTEDTAALGRQRWPSMSVTTESNTGNARSAPTKAVQLQQTLWDFGRLSARIAEAEAAADVSAINVHLQQQDLFLQIVNAWQSMQAGRERIKVAEGALGRLKAYKAQMLRRVKAEVSPRIDLELVDARLLQTEVELMAAKTSMQVALTRLEQYTGLSQLQSRFTTAPPMPNLKETVAFSNLLHETDWHSVASSGPSVAKARAQLKQIQQKLEGKKSEAWPQLYARAYKPLGASTTGTDNSTTTFIGLSYTPGAGFVTLAEATALGTRVSGAQLSIDTATLEMQQTLQSDHEEYANARLRIGALEKSVEGSDLVLVSYKRQFEAGKKTWIDLLNAVRELAQNEYSLADAKASMMGSMYRLQLRMGAQPD